MSDIAMALGLLGWAALVIGLAGFSFSVAMLIKTIANR